MIAATMAAASLFVGGGMLLSSAHTDQPAPAAAPASVTAPTPAFTPRPAPTIAAVAVPADPAAYRIERVLDIPGPMHPGDYHWSETGAPATGPVVVTIDLKAQTLSIFRAGYEIGTAVVIYGADDKMTPLGVFPILQKQVKHRSTLYDAEMPYMQRLTSDGVAIHASRIGPNLGTHGCIGVPLAFAKLLYGATKLGDRVIVTRGEMLTVGGAVTAKGVGASAT